jgi:cell division protein ZapA
MEKTRTIVNICGKEYVMAGYESEEYIHKVAIHVDKKMNELKGQYISLNTSTLAVLTALNITDDLLKLQEKFDSLNNEYQALNEEIKKSRIEDNQRSNVSLINKQGKGAVFDGYK